jgi:hypothetical protein
LSPDTGGAATLEAVLVPMPSSAPELPQQRTLPDWKSAQKVVLLTEPPPEISIALSAAHLLDPESHVAPTTQVPGLVPQHAWPTFPQAVQAPD